MEKAGIPSWCKSNQLLRATDQGKNNQPGSKIRLPGGFKTIQ